MADDLGYGDLSCYGSTQIQTPNIDMLAANGIKFMDFHSNGAVCSPTRAALLTGRYQQRSGIEGVVTARGHRHTGMALSETTFAEVLKTAGYTTALFGKWHLGYQVEFNPVKQGFDEFRGYVSGNVDYISHVDQTGYEDWWLNDQLVPEEGYSTDLITDHGVRFIEKNRDKPFCLYLAHESPHYPYQGRNDKPDRFPNTSFPNHGSRPDKKAAYKEMINALDDGIGRIVEIVNKLGLAENTFIFFCSDNGALLQVGSNGLLRGAKGSLWEGGHRVPAVATWPGHIKPGIVTHETVLSMDLFPTMASLAGAEIPEGLDGMDISHVLLKNEQLQQRALFWRFKKQKAIRKGPWKLLIDSNKKHLFNLDDDLSEQNNLADKETTQLKILEKELLQWEKEVIHGIELRTQ